MPKKPTYRELEKRVTELEAQQQQLQTEIADRQQAEEALRENEKKFRGIVETANEGILLAGTDGKITFANERMGQIIGYTVEELIGMTGAELVADREELAKAQDLAKKREAGVRSDYEIRMRRKDASEVWLRASGTPVYDDARRHVGNLGMYFDITKRKQAEEAQRKSEQRLTALVESAPVGIVIHGPDGCLLRSNPEAWKLLGVSESEALGKNLTDPAWQFLREDRSVMPVEDYPVSQVLARQAPLASMVLGIQRGNPGDLVWVVVNALPRLSDEDGSVAEIIVTFTDISDRKRAEEALRESEERLRRIARAGQIGYFEWNDKKDTAYWSPEHYELLGYEQGSPITWERWLADVHPEDRDRVLKNAACLLKRGQLEGQVRGHKDEYRFIRADGSVIWIESDVSLDMVDSEAIIRGSIRDITERKRTEEALRASEELLRETNTILEQKVRDRTQELAQRALQLRALAGELTLSEQRERSRLAKVLHDHLQQLLVAAKFRVTILGRGGDDVTKQASKEVEELINESIAASRSLTAELSPPILHEAGLNAGLQWLARRMPEMQGLFVDLELEEDGDLPQDVKMLLFESVRELLFNVVKHARTRSARVHVRRIDGRLQAIVSDHGVGFDPAAIPAAGEGGRGFGLFSIRERLELMGGTFELESAPGQGSRIVLSVPVAPAATIEPPPQAIPVLPEVHLMTAGYPDPKRKIRVMLVDDHAVVRQGMANLLGDEPDMEVVGQAADGQEAVEQAARLLPDVILMDMSMPKLNGVEATRIIHNDWPDIRIIGLSMFEEADRAQAMRDAGAVDYITKSGPAEELINLIRASVQAEKKTLSAKT